MRHRPRIVRAAVKFNGRIYEGLRHAEIMRRIWDEQGTTQVKIYQEDQGFMTDDGRFVNRFQAGAVAFCAGQTKTRKQNLLSEDVW